LKYLESKDSLFVDIRGARSPGLPTHVYRQAIFFGGKVSILSENLQEGYGIIPRKVMRSKDLSIYEKAMLAYFLSFTGAGKNSCWPSLNIISKELGISRTTVKKYIKELQEKGWIGKTRYDDDNKFSVNMYTMYFNFTTGEKYKVTKLEPGSPDGPSWVNECPTPGSPDGPPLGRQMPTNINTKKNKNNNKNEKYFPLSKLLRDLHKKQDEKYKPTDSHLKTWANDIRLLCETDSRDYQDIEAVIRWVKRPGCFWFPNIMSGKKLREKFPMLWAQYTSDKKSGYKPKQSGPSEMDRLTGMV
jgi:hypothetical protein